MHSCHLAACRASLMFGRGPVLSLGFTEEKKAFSKKNMFLCQIAKNFSPTESSGTVDRNHAIKNEKAFHIGGWSVRRMAANGDEWDFIPPPPATNGRVSLLKKSLDGSKGFRLHRRFAPWFECIFFSWAYNNNITKV